MPRRQQEEDDEGFGEASRYTAHLDRGWSLLDRGDLQQARNSAHQALKIRPEVPDGAMLMAAVCLAESDPEGGLEWYERAIEADSDYVDAQLAAAQILLYDLDEPQRALERAEIARELDEATVADHIDLGLLEVEALVGMGDNRGARERLANLGELATLEQLLSPDSSQEQLREALEEFIGEPYELEGEEWEPIVQRAMQLAVRVARLHIDIGGALGAADAALLGSSAAAALPWIDALLRTFRSDPEIWYLANEAAYVAGDPVRAAQAALQVLQLDAAQPIPEWAPEPTELHVKVVDLLLESPDPQLRELARAPSFVVLVNDAPPFELCLEGVDPRVRVLALSARNARELEPTLTGLALYRRNLVRLARDRLQLDREIELAVFDEIAMFYSFDDARRERLGLPPSEWIEARGRREVEPDDGRRKLGKPRPEVVRAEPVDAVEPVDAAAEPVEPATEPLVVEAEAIAEPPAAELLPLEPAPARKTRKKKAAKAASKKARASEEQAPTGKAKRKAGDKPPRKRPVGDHDD